MAGAVAVCGRARRRGWPHSGRSPPGQRRAAATHRGGGTEAGGQRTVAQQQLLLVVATAAEHAGHVLQPGQHAWVVEDSALQGRRRRRWRLRRRPAGRCPVPRKSTGLPRKPTAHRVHWAALGPHLVSLLDLLRVPNIAPGERAVGVRLGDLGRAAQDLAPDRHEPELVQWASILDFRPPLDAREAVPARPGERRVV